MTAVASLTFLGGAGSVTGSKFLIETGGARVLVDCGLFQGLSTLRRKNWDPPAFDVRSLDAVVLTHAHLDHCGYLPLLVRHGWHGPVYCTEGTARLAEIVLTDSAHLLEEEAAQANEGGWSKHHPALPLYDQADARRAIRLLTPIRYGETTGLPTGIELVLGRAGHILGSSWAKLRLPIGDGSRSVVISGDLGRPDHPLLAPPDPRPHSDVLLIESTYGDRAHQSWDGAERLASVIRQTVRGGGSVLMPAFAVDRTEVILYHLARLRAAGAIPDLPVVVDSPMALTCLDVYRDALKNQWPDVRTDLGEGDLFDPGHLLEAHTADESARWNDPPMPALIVSASGMASGGRVLHHLRHLLPDRHNTIAIVGFAAAGTRARQLIDGAAQVKIHGRYIPVRARVEAFDAFSAHADRDQLFAWATAGPAPETCFVVHGEPASSAAFAARLVSEAGWTAVTPREAEKVLI